MFRNAVCVPIDIFTLNFAYFYQVSVGNIHFYVKKLAPHIQTLSSSLSFVIDLRSHAEMFKKLVNMMAILKDLDADVSDVSDHTK